MKNVNVISAIPKGLRAISNWVHESLESWAEMAPYNISSMSQGFSSKTVFGYGSLAVDPAKMKVADPRSDYRRREMLAWHFLAMSRSQFGRFSTSSGISWIRLGGFYLEQRDPGNALKYHKKGLEIVEADRADEPSHDDVILFDARLQALECFLKLDKPAEAAPILVKLVETLRAYIESPGKFMTRRFERQEENASDLLVKLMLDHARVLSKLSQFDHSVKALEALTNLLEGDGLSHSEQILEAYRELARVHRALGDEVKFGIYDELSNRLDFLAIMESSCGKDSRTLATEFDGLAALYRKLGKHELVRELENRIKIVNLLSKVKGPDYPGIERDLDTLAEFFENRGEGGDGVLAFRFRKRIEAIQAKS